jgi:sugar lactone lactonase YvrE
MNWVTRSLCRFSANLLLLACSAVVAAEPSMQALCGKCVAAKFATCGGFLEGASIDPTGGLWVLDLSGDRILNVTDKGECVARGKAGGGPGGSKFTHDGRMIITGRKGLLSFDPATGQVTTLVDTFEGKPLLAPNDLALDKDEGVYFTVPSGSDLRKRDGRVFYLAPGASAPTLVADQIAFPNGIAVSADGRSVLVSEFAEKRVLLFPAVTAKFIPGGAPLLSYVYTYTQSGVGGDGIAFDGHGRLYTANITSGAVEVFAPDASHVGFIRLPEGAGPNVTNLAFRGSYLYVTEASRGEVWRVHLNN